MNLRLDKWYLDVQSGSRFRYFYVARLTAGGLQLVTVESHDHEGERLERFSAWGRDVAESKRSLSCKRGSITAGRRRVSLALTTAHGPLTVEWLSSAPPPCRPFRPLFRNSDGWCDWKVWAPSASVTVNEGGLSRTGIGYVDFVRFALPFWRIPFRSLRWGRLASPARWLVFFHLDTGSEALGSVLDEAGWERDVSVVSTSGKETTLPLFTWRIGSREVTVHTLRILEAGPILSRKRLGRAVPQRVADALGSRGREAKYWSTCQLEGHELSGPMEEVTWGD